MVSSAFCWVKLTEKIREESRALKERKERNKITTIWNLFKTFSWLDAFFFLQQTYDDLSFSVTMISIYNTSTMLYAWHNASVNYFAVYTQTHYQTYPFPVQACEKVCYEWLFTRALKLSQLNQIWPSWILLCKYVTCNIEVHFIPGYFLYLQLYTLIKDPV